MKSAGMQYATALADVAQGQKAAGAVTKQLNEFAAAYAASGELRNFLASPAVTRAEKHAVIEKLAARMGASTTVRNFLLVVTDNGRTHLLPEIVETFQRVMRERQGVAEAEIVSATELSDAQKKNFSQTLEKLTGKKVEANFRLEPGLLGGAVVRIGSTVYDGSVRNRLNELRARLAAE